MIRRFCTFASRHATALYLSRDGLRILAVLALALTLFGASPSGSAQAAPDREFFIFKMSAFPSATYVCVGETMTLRVEIFIELAEQPGDTAPRFGHIRGAWVFADFVSGDGGISPEGNIFTSHGEIAPDSATFTFKAGPNPGTATLKFTSFVSEFWNGTGHHVVSGEPYEIVSMANIEVRKCSYKVNQVYLANIPGIMSFAHAADEATLVKEGDNHFVGTVPFHRAIKVLIHDHGYGPGILLCQKKPLRLGGWTVLIEPIMVDYKADLTNGTLYLTSTVPKYKDIYSETCTGSSASAEQWTGSGATPFTFLTSFPPEGGTAFIKGPYGFVLITVERVPLPEP